MAPASGKKTLHRYQAVSLKLDTKLKQLLRKREELKSRGATVPEEGGGGDGGRSPLEEQTVYRAEVTSLLSTATNLLIESIELKLSYTKSKIGSLQILLAENHKAQVPRDLRFSRYEEWLETNQRLFEMQSQLYDLEKLKFELKQKHVLARRAIAVGATSRQESGNQFVASSAQHIQSFLNRFTFTTPAATLTQTYIQDLLNPRGNKTTVECQKVQEYISECLRGAQRDVDSSNVQGGHPQAYQQFMAVLVSYIREKQKDLQSEELAGEIVYAAVERYIIPRIKAAVLRYVAQSERDVVLQQQCQRFAGITLDQLKVRERLQSKEVVPFIGSITQLRASYFSPNPTDKMYSVVAAAKALYEQLSVMGESSIDGDAFLDLWIYVIIKANVKDLATNLSFMVEYGNPQLANDEAGYYLTTVEAAVAFIENLTPESLRQPQIPMSFVVCERDKFARLASTPSSCVVVERREEVLTGYRVAVVREWVLNQARLFSSVLVATGNHDDTATVSVIRLDADCSKAAHVQYFRECFTRPGRGTGSAETDGATWLSCQATSLGHAVVADRAAVDTDRLILLPSGDFEQHSRSVLHVLQLVRLGSQGHDEPTDSRHHPTTPINAYPHTLPLPRTQNASHPRSHSSSRPVLIKQQRTTDDNFGYLCTIVADSRDKIHKTSFPASPYLLVSDDSKLLSASSSSTVSARSTRGGEKRSSRRLGSNRTETETKTGHSKTVQVKAEVHTDLLGDDYSASSASVDASFFTASQGSAETFQTANGSIAGAHEAGRDETLRLAPAQAPPSGERPLSSEQLENGESGSGAEVGVEVVAEEGLCPLDSSPAIESQRLLEEDCVQFLERNFARNHLYGDGTQAVQLAAESIIRESQLYLQRLHYLSTTANIDGVFSDITLLAIQSFQRVHNEHESRFSVVLPENGYLTAATFQYLRQAFLTVYASMLRLGLDQDLGENFNPMSTTASDVEAFKHTVVKFQKTAKLRDCAYGALCSLTVDSMRHLIRTNRHTVV